MDATAGNRKRARPWVIPIGLGLTAAMYALDLSLPLGVAGGLPYVAVVLLSLWSPDPRHTLIAAALGTGLTIAGYVLSPVGGVPWMIAVNRGLAIGAIWVTAILALRCRQNGLALQEARDTLETRVIERTADLAEIGRALQASEERLRRAVVEAPIPIMIHAEDGEVVRINKAWTDVTGFTHDEIPTIADWTERAYGQRRDAARAIIDRLYATDQRLDEGEFRVDTKEGASRTWHFFSAPLGPLTDGRRAVISTAVDVTARKRVEVALSESEARLRTMLASTPDPIFTIDPSGIVQSISDSVRHVFGWEPDALVGRHVRVLMPERHEYLAACLRAATSGSPSEPLELEAVRQDGSVFPCETTIWRVDLPGQDEPAFMGIVRDITDRRDAVEALRASEAKFRSLFENAPDYVLLLELDGTIRSINRTVKSLTVEKVVGTSVFDQNAPAYRETIQACLDGVIRSGEPGSYEVVWTAPNGDRRDFSARVGPVKRGERVEGLVLVGTDITEFKQAERALRESEERFRQLAENCQEVFWLTTPQAKDVLYVSPAYEKLWGRPCRELYESPQAWLEPLHPDDRKRLVRRMENAPSPNRGPHEEEFRLVRPDGTIRWIRSRSVPICDERGQVYRLAGLSEDITGRKQADDDRRRHRDELAHVARLSTMGEMAAGIAHELNQPLAAIVNYVDAARLNVGRGKTGRDALLADLDHAADQAVRAGTIIRRLRNLVRKQETRSEPVQINDLAKDVLGLIDAEIRMAGVTLRLRLTETLPDVKADAIQIQQVLINLLRNGLDAMAETPRERRRLILRSRQADADLVEVAVADTGCGIDAEHDERVFEPFFSTKANGMGMGLSINRSIIEAHGGRLWATCNQAGGTTFHITLPIAQGDATNGHRTDGICRR